MTNGNNVFRLIGVKLTDKEDDDFVSEKRAIIEKKKSLRVGAKERLIASRVCTSPQFCGIIKSDTN